MYRFLIFAFLAVSLSLQASTLREHKLTEALDADEALSLGSDLAGFLGVLNQCPENVRASMKFGQEEVSLRYADNRSSVTYTYVAVGYRPQPSGAKYTTTITVSSKSIPRPKPAPADAPPLRKIECKSEIK